MPQPIALGLRFGNAIGLRGRSFSPFVNSGAVCVDDAATPAWASSMGFIILVISVVIDTVIVVFGNGQGEGAS